MWYYVVAKSTFKHAREECESKRLYVITVCIKMLPLVYMFVYVFMSEVISSFKSLRAGSQVFALRMLFSLFDFAHYVVGYKSLQLLCILPFGMLCLSAIRMMFVKIILAVGMVGGYGGLSESGLCVFCKLCPVGSLVFGKSSAVLL